MIERRNVVKREPGVRLVFGKTGDQHPVKAAWGRPSLPPNWSPKLDADEIARIREDLRILELTDGYVRSAYSLIW